MLFERSVHITASNKGNNDTNLINLIGVQRSLVARLTGGQEAMGSSPVTPTTNFAECIHSVHSVFYIRSTCACANVETDIKTSTLCVPKFVQWNEPLGEVPKLPSFLNCHEPQASTTKLQSRVPLPSFLNWNQPKAYVPRNFACRSLCSGTSEASTTKLCVPTPPPYHERSECQNLIHSCKTNQMAFKN